MSAAPISAPIVESNEAATDETSEALRGNVVRVPRSPLRLVLSALTLVLLGETLVDLFSGHVLARKRHAELRTSAAGVTLEVTTSLLGRAPRTATRFVPWSSIEEIAFEPEGPKRALPVGLAALALGTAVGSGLFVEGLRASGGVASVALGGLLAIALGVLLDYLLERGGARRGPAPPRLVFRFTRGAIALSGVNAARAELLLAEASSRPPSQALPEPPSTPSEA